MLLAEPIFRVIWDLRLALCMDGGCREFTPPMHQSCHPEQTFRPSDLRLSDQSDPAISEAQDTGRPFQQTVEYSIMGTDRQDGASADDGTVSDRKLPIPTP